MRKQMTDLYNVFWKDPEGNQHKELSYGNVEEMESALTRLTNGPAARGGIIKEVLVTDSMDCTLVLWREGKLIHPQIN